MFNDTQRVKIVVEPAAVGAHQFVKLVFSGVAKWRMADVVNESESLRQRGIQAKSGGHGAGDLGDFNGVCEAIAKVVRKTHGENLGFGFQAAERARMHDA